ncbi:MAG TPA: hypothetical protein VGO59_14365 [Verrucomicrobiae bacterium]
MKGLLAILFSAALIVSQAAFLPSGQAASVQKCCGHCNCCKGDPCCTGAPDSRHPAPAVPARGVSQNDLQVLAAVVAAPFPPRPPLVQRPISSLSFSFPAAAPPLYQRHCSYII